ncbi:MAG: DUF2064 domain-containing protein [Bacteroidia bacterium]|nr:DUF2064 domain-containing protein [Bacteroidia bacterium]
MTPEQTRTAILLFARTPQAEIQHKWLPKGELLYEQFNEHSQNLISRSGRSFFHFSEKDQQGENFGEKFANAFQRIFDLGFDRIISIGNDSPHLTNLEIRTAIQSLEAGNQVLGPSRDGGIYLLGLLSSEFDKERFLEFSWGRRCLYTELKEYFEINNKTPHILPAIIDVDNSSDIPLLLRFSKFIPIGIIQFLQTQLNRVKILDIEVVLAEITPFYTPNSNKGSPAYLPIPA